MLGSAAIAGGRLIWDVSPLVYGGGMALVAASLWNLWLKRRRPVTLVRFTWYPKEERYMATQKRTVEVFSAGCLCCDEAVKLVQRIALPQLRRADP